MINGTHSHPSTFWFTNLIDFHFYFFDNHQFNRFDNSSLIRDDLVEDGLEKLVLRT